MATPRLDAPRLIANAESVSWMNDPIYIAKAKEPIYLLPKMANRHGLIAGATGTGKTVTLQTLAENFSVIRT